MATSTTRRDRIWLVGYGEAWRSGSARHWVIEAGRLVSTAIVGAGSEVTTHPDDPDMLAVDGDEHPHWRAALPHVVNIAARVVPWVRWHCAPEFRAADGTFARWGGLAHRFTGVVLLRTGWDLRWSVGAAFHEAWHAIEPVLTLAEMAAVDAAVARGPALPDPDYTAHVEERRAHAFEAWALSRWEAPAPARPGSLGRLLDTAARRLLPPHERVFLAVYEGDVARRAARRGWVPSHRLPAATRQRAAAERQAARRPLSDRLADRVIAAGAAFDAATSWPAAALRRALS